MPLSSLEPSRRKEKKEEESVQKSTVSMGLHRHIYHSHSLASGQSKTHAKLRSLIKGRREKGKPLRRCGLPTEKENDDNDMTNTHLR